MSSSQLTGLASYTHADTPWMHYVSPHRVLITKPRQYLAGAACLTASKLLLAPQPQPYKRAWLSPWIAPGIICDLGVWLPYRPPHRWFMTSITSTEGLLPGLPCLDSPAALLRVLVSATAGAVADGEQKVAAGGLSRPAWACVLCCSADLWLGIQQMCERFA